MAFQKDTAEGVIVFTYPKGTLFNNASLRSTYKARSLVDQQGNYTGEAYALSDDERDAFEVCVDNVVPDVYDVLMKMTSGVNGAFGLDGVEVILKIQDNKAYNENVLKNVDISIQNALVYGVLREWYDLCAKPDFYAEYALKYQMMINSLRDRLFQLKKKLLE